MPSLRGRRFRLRGCRSRSRTGEGAPTREARTFSHNPFDWGLVALYFAFLGLVWWRARKRRPGTVDYMVAGRAVTLPAFVATLVATWYGGILGVGEYSWRYGVANWLVFGVPYYVGALLFALFFARRARTAALYTIPDLLERRYGRGPALFGAFAVFVTSAPAAYVLVLGTLFSAMTGWALAPCVVAAAALSLFYIDKGGLRTVVLTDQVQFALMYAGFIMMLVFLVVRYGALPFHPGAVPAAHFTWNGGNPPQAIFVWYVIALSTLVDPGFWQRAYAAGNPKIARDGVLWSIAWWALFDFMTTACGLYARALLPSLHDPVYAFPELARVALPPVALGIFYLGMIATVMSTIDSYGFIAATTIGRDFVWRLRQDPDDSRVPAYSRVGLWIATLFAATLALANHSVIDLWHDIGSVITPVLLAPVAAALLGVAAPDAGWTLAAMIAPFLVTLGWVLARNLGPAHAYPLALEPIYAGLAASLAVFALGLAFSRKGVRSMDVARTPLAALLAASLLLSLDPGRAAAAAHAAPDTVAADTLSHVVALPGVEVSTARATETTPIARSVLGRPELQKLNWGQDTPMALTSLPGAYAYSDAGNGVGYSYLSIRGFPQRRISVLINGVPLNDPESHEVYWIDHPDLLASTSEAQVQRGVGSALYGSPSVGGAVNLETSPFSDAPHFVASTSYGSFDTQHRMFEMSSGPLPGQWDAYGRYSRIDSRGYRDQSWTHVWSYYLSARKTAGRQTFRLNLYGGPETTHLAYQGVTRGTLDGGVTGSADADRRMNPLTYSGEADHFFEPHYELLHSWVPRDGLAVTQTLFWFDGSGYYDEQRFDALTNYRLTPWAADTTLYGADHFDDGYGGQLRDAQGRLLMQRTDIVRRRWVANHHYGWVPRMRVDHARGTLTFGGELRGHDGHHWGEVLSGDGLPPGTPANAPYYDYHPHTWTGSAYAREEWRPAPAFTVTGDLAYRHQHYAMRDDKFGGVSFGQDYDFLLPRLGLTWKPNTPTTLFASWAYSEREPRFTDLFNPEESGSVPLYAHYDPATNAYSDPLVKPEKVNDYEIGASYARHGWTATANLFRMDFRDELVDFQFNSDLATWVTANAARSLHQGVELALAGATRRGGVDLGLDANATFGDNHFVDFKEAVDQTTTIDHAGQQIGFFPATLANLGGTVGWQGVTLGAQAQYTGALYVANDESPESRIAPHTVLNLTGAWHFRIAAAGAATLGVRVLNATDLRYETGGYWDYDPAGNYAPLFIPAATRNVIGELKLAF